MLLSLIYDILSFFLHAWTANKMLHIVLWIDFRMFRLHLLTECLIFAEEMVNCSLHVFQGGGTITVGSWTYLGQP